MSFLFFVHAVRNNGFKKWQLQVRREKSERATEKGIFRESGYTLVEEQS